MSEFDSKKDYYGILGADERASDRELERLYKRMAARRHPDKGGSEEEMKTLNEAYRVLHNAETRRSLRRRAQPAARRRSCYIRSSRCANSAGCRDFSARV